MTAPGNAPDPKARIVVDPAQAGMAGMYHLMNAAVAPRPVAWVSTISEAGVPNLAPHSYTTVFATDPPVIGFVSVGRKDNLANVEATGEFVCNIAGLAVVEQLNLTAADFPPEEDEFAWAGLTRVASDLVAPPRVGEATVSFEARVSGAGRLVPVGNATLVLGEVVRVHVDEAVWVDGRIDPVRLRPVLRLAGSTFGVLGATFDLRRPSYADVLNGDLATVPPGVI